MTRRPRERILQKLVYEHYVRPHFDFYQLATAERSLIYSFAEEMTGGEPTADSVALVRRWFDKAWRRAEREWANIRDGGPRAFYRNRASAETPDTNQRVAFPAFPARVSADAPTDEHEPEQLELPATEPDRAYIT